MTFFALLPLTSILVACLLVCVLSIVYVWSPNSARRTRAWRLLYALLRVVTRGRGEGE